MVSSAKKKLAESRHAYHHKQSQSLVRPNLSSKESAKIPKEYLEMATNFPLHLAAMHGNPNGIQRLLTDGCDINQLDAEKRTPIMLAALFGRRENVSCLMDHGASTISKDIFGQKAIDYAYECRCNEKKRTEVYGWHLLDLKHLSLECRIIVSLLKGNQKTHKCPSRPEKFPEYYAVRSGKNIFTIMAPIFQVTVNNADKRTIAWTLSKGTLDIRASAVSGWSFTKYKNPPDFLLDSEEWTDKVVMLSNLVGHDLHGGNHDHGEYGRMFSSHAEKQIIAFIAWEQVLGALSSDSPRAWKRSRQAEVEDEVEIFVSRIPCRWCEDLCQKTNTFLGMNMKLVFVHRVQNLADRCGCGGCMCELPTPKVIIPMRENLSIENPGELSMSPAQPQTPTKQQPKRKSAIDPLTKTTTLIENPSPKQKKIAITPLLLTPEPSPKKSERQSQKSPTKSTISRVKTRQLFSVLSSDSSETEDGDWVPLEMPSTPTKLPKQSKIKSTSKPKASFLDSDNDSDISEWQPKRPSSAKRKSTGMSLDESPSKRQRLDSQKALLTSSKSHQLVLSPTNTVHPLPFAKYRYEPEESASPVKKSTAIMNMSPAKMTSVKSVKTSLTKTTTTTTISPIKAPKRKGRPAKRKLEYSFDED